MSYPKETQQALERVRRQLNGTSPVEIWPLTQKRFDIAAANQDWELIADLWKAENPDSELYVRDAVYAYFAKQARAMNEEHAKHTPGPWTIRSEGGGRYALLEQQSSDIRSPEALANARLFANAPALLEAAKEALRIEELWAPPGCGPIDKPEDIEALDNLRTKLAAAIQLAEGEGC